jgi:hypothetical protein
MDWLQFFASIIGSTAWPIGLVICVLLLRRELVSLLGRLRRFKYGDAEAEFGEKLEEAAQEIAELPAPAHRALRQESTKPRDVEDFSNNSAVFVSWLEVESAILNLARKAKVLRTNMPASIAADILLKKELIDYPTYRAIRELMNLRNIAVHPSNARLISKEEADRFKSLADKVAGILEDRGQGLG